jgi:hypothetical protein
MAGEQRARLPRSRSMLGRPKEWSIAIYAGASLDALAPLDTDDRPTLTFRDVDGLPARFVADSFLVRHQDEWLLFFEALNASREKGEIALARSADAIAWRYDGAVLRESHHLSYPSVFAAGDEWLMTPEALEAGGVLLYRADDFPRHWSLDRVLIEGAWADPTVFEHDGGWWMFGCPTPYQHDRLELFWSDDVRGPWHRHPSSPVVSGDPRRSRPAGRPCRIDGTLVRFAQDCRPDYGTAVRAFAVTKLTRHDYVERELAAPVVTATGSGWNADGMHTVDLHPWRGRWIAAVDGYRYLPAPQCELVSTLEQFDALAGEWDALLQRSTAHAIFGSHAWMRAALVCRPERLPHVATLRIDGRLEAILPFVRTPDGIEFATFLSDYNDFIAAERRHAARAFHWLLGTLPSGSRVVMRGLREDSDALVIVRAFAPGDCIVPETNCFYANVDESYFRTRSRGLRKAIARARRAATDAGAEVKPLTDAGVAEIFLALNRRRFGDGSRFGDPAAETFVREALPPLVRSGAVEPYAVVRREEVLAIDLVLVTGDALAPWNGGFAAEAAPLGPGRLLFAAEIERALADGKPRFDLLRGDHPYKRAWSTGSQMLHRAEVIAP